MRKRLNKDEGPTNLRRSARTREKLPIEKRTHTSSVTRSQSSRQKLENDLKEGYLANAASARAFAEEMMSAEADLA